MYIILTSKLKLNSRHPVFAGHFPERAILPGVVMVEILKRAVEKVVKKELVMKEAQAIKFLKMIEPDLIDRLELKLSITQVETEIKVRGQLSKDQVIYFKENVIFIEK